LSQSRASPEGARHSIMSRKSLTFTKITRYGVLANGWPGKRFGRRHWRPLASFGYSLVC
jgi:hypothetical protein